MTIIIKSYQKIFVLIKFAYKKIFKVVQGYRDVTEFINIFGKIQVTQLPKT